MTVFSDNDQGQLRAIGDEVLERWRSAMADGNHALVGELVRTSHALRDAKRTLGQPAIPAVAA